MDKQAKVEVLINLQLSDLLRASYWYFFSKWSNRIIMVIFILISVVSALAFLLSNSASSTSYGLYALVIMIVPALLVGTVYIQTKRNFSNLKEFQKNIRYTFAYDGYDVRDEKSSSHVSWDSILRAVETETSFNLFFHKVLFYTVPKRCIRQYFGQFVDGKSPANQQFFVRFLNYLQVSPAS